MTKYNQLFKQQVVNFYFEHHENLALILKHFNLAAKTVRYWISQSMSRKEVVWIMQQWKAFLGECKRSVFTENRLLALMNLKRLSMIMSGTIMKNESN